MDTAVSIVMPAYNAVATIGAAVASVLAQSHEDWQLLIISDDGRDYAEVLAGQGIADPRLRFLSTGRVKAGASNARNIALDRIATRYAAVLDADDRYKPQKLARAVAALARQPIVSTALEVMSEDGRSLRTVAAGPDRVLRAGQHKWLNFSMDTMIAWDRQACDARYDPELPNMTDLDFLMKLYRTSPASFHIGEPLHDYVKLSVSMSNGPGVTERMIAVKTLLLQRLADGYYPMADEEAAESISEFLRLSRSCEKPYEAALARMPGLLFEDQIEPLLGRPFAP
ncbi:MAG: glycosyltransferase family 2 protein [Hyphomicrobiales bacterium]|nr:glycosyltransferase family 2 protein [Hyphomicrobiales bacterium]